MPILYGSMQEYLTTTGLLQWVVAVMVSLGFVILAGVWSELTRNRQRIHRLESLMTALIVAIELQNGPLHGVVTVANENRVSSSDPGYVFKLVGLLFVGAGILNASGLIAAMAFKGIAIENKYTLIFVVVAIGLPVVSGLMLASDKIRDKVLDWADKTSLIPFKKKDTQ